MVGCEYANEGGRRRGMKEREGLLRFLMVGSKSDNFQIENFHHHLTTTPPKPPHNPPQPPSPPLPIQSQV